MVPVPDKRLDALKNRKSGENTALHGRFCGYCGLVKGASKGEGLGTLWGHIKDVGVVLHVVRCFEDGNITHVENSVDFCAILRL